MSDKQDRLATDDATQVDREARPMAPLERRYRRWVGLYPVAYRIEREDELVGVLLDTATPDQVRPRLAEVVDLARAAAVAHVRTARTSTSRREWSDASVVVGIILSVVLGAQSVRYLTVVARRASFSGPYAEPLSWFEVRGWYVPVAWAIVVALLALGRTRLACAAAWLASVARLAAVYEVATVPPFPWSTQVEGLAAATPIVVQLTLGLIAAVLLSRPRRVRAVVDSIGRTRLVVSVVAFSVVLGAQRWNNLWGSGFDIWVLVVPFALALACWVGDVRFRLVPLHPVARRIGAGLLAVLVVFVVSDAASAATGPGGIVTRRDLVAIVAVGLGTAIVAALVLAVAPIAARRLPFRLVRRPPDPRVGRSAPLGE